MSLDERKKHVRRAIEASIQSTAHLRRALMATDVDRMDLDLRYAARAATNVHQIIAIIPAVTTK